MATAFLSRALLVLPFVFIPLHVMLRGSRLLRRSRLGGLRAIRSAAFLVFAPVLLSAIFALPEVGHLPREEGADSELGELKLKMSRLESILGKNIKDLNSKVLLLQEKDRVIEEMNRKIQYLQNSLRNMKKSRGGSAYSEERVNSMEEEIRNLWGEARKNNFDLHTLQSKAYDAEEKLDSMSSQVHKMEDITTEQWIQIRQLEQALQITKVFPSFQIIFWNMTVTHCDQVRTSKAYKNMEHIGCIFLKFIHDLHQHHLPEAICHMRSFFFKKSLFLNSHAFTLLKRVISGVQRYHLELQGYVREIMEKNEFTEAFTNQEVIFFLASAIITFPFMAAWLLYSSNSGSSEED